MGELQNQMLRLMELKNFSRKTISCYLMYMKEYVRKYKKSPAELGEEEILSYLYFMKNEKKASWSAMNIAYSSIKFFYKEVLDREWNVKKIPRPKVEKRLPEVLSREEVKRLLERVVKLEHRVALMTTYSAGLRVSETVHLKISDIDSDRMQIRVNQGKGKKDRYSILSEKLLEELRQYYREQKPEEWLFPGKEKNKPLNQSTLQRVFNESKKKLVLISRQQYIPYATVLQHTF